MPFEIGSIGVKGRTFEKETYQNSLVRLVENSLQLTS